MTKENQTKNEGLISFIASVIKKSADLPQDVSLLAGSVKILANELSRLSQHVLSISLAVKNHNAAINDLIEVQNYILKHMSQSVSSEQKMPDLHKEKSNKFN
jgi:hypothetical protein